MTQEQQELEALTRTWAAMKLAELEYKRQLVKAVEATSVRQAARQLNMGERGLASQLETARHVKAPKKGHKSAGPYEVCLRYAAGQLGREETITLLTAWPYEPAGDMHTSPGDDLIIIPEGSIHDLSDAKWDKLIDADMRETVLDALSDDNA